MKRFSRFKHLLSLAAVLAVGLLVPAHAVRPLGAAEDFAVLAGTTVTIDGATSVDDGLVGGGGGVSGSAITYGGEGAAATGGQVTAGLTSLLSAIGTLNALPAETLGSTNLAANDPDGAGAGVYGPGIYTVTGNATMSADITLDGNVGSATAPNVWIFLIRGGTLLADQDIFLINGALAGNVYFVAENGITLSSDKNGIFIAGDGDTVGNITFDSGTINGKVLATGSILLADTDDAAINDPVVGAGPSLTLSPTTTSYVRAPGQALTFTANGADQIADGGPQSIAADLSGLPGAPSFPTVTEGDDSVDSTFNWDTTGVASGAYSTTIYTTDDDGLIDFQIVNVRINAAPSLIADVLSPLDICAGDPLTINLTADDPDGDSVTITNTGATPTGADFSATPGDPATATFSLTGAETAALAGQSFALQFTANDGISPATTLNIALTIDTLPTIAINQISPESGAVSNPGTLVTCVGETLVFDVTAADADATEDVRLQVSDLPVGAVHAPNYFGDEDELFGADDTLIAAANPGTTRFTWTPTLSDLGSRTLTYTATDDASDGVECSSTFSVTLVVTRRPTISITANGTPVADNGAVVLCPSPGPGNTTTLRITGADADAGDVTITRTDGTAFPGTLTPSNFSVAGNPAIQDIAVVAPTEAQLGNGPRTFNLTFTATDLQGCVDTQTITLTVTRNPVVTASTNAFSLCPGQTVNYTVTAADGDPGDTLSVAVSPASVPGLSHSLGLPAVGNPVTINGIFTAQASQAGTSIPVTYTATDEDGCIGTTTVTFTVEVPVPSLVALDRTPNTPSVAVDTEVCFTARVEDQCGQPVEGASVLFDIEGEPGIDLDFGPGPVSAQGSQGGGFVDVDFAAVTDENGEAVFCYTPRFPTTQAIRVTAGLDSDNDGQIDPGEDTLEDSFTVDVPASTAGTLIAGDGAILVGTTTTGRGRNIRTVPARGLFHLEVRGTTAGGSGGATFNIPGRVDLPEGVPGDLGSNFSLRSLRIDAVTAIDTPGGRRGSVFGTARTTAYGPLPFRIDVIDNGTPGVARDSYRLSLLSPDGIITLGSTLVKPGRGKNNIQVRFGVAR